MTTLVLTRARRDAHEAWLDRGQTGDGRIVASGTAGPHLHMQAWMLTAARFEDAHFTTNSLASARLDHAEFVRCTFTETRFMQTRIRHAHFEDCVFDACSLVLSRGEGLRVTGGALRNCDLEKAKWPGATLSNVDLRGARFAGARLQHARFEGCDLEGAQFTGADLEGATFVGCSHAPSAG